MINPIFPPHLPPDDSRICHAAPETTGITNCQFSSWCMSDGKVRVDVHSCSHRMRREEEAEQKKRREAEKAAKKLNGTPGKTPKKSSQNPSQSAKKGPKSETKTGPLAAIKAALAASGASVAASIAAKLPTSATKKGSQAAAGGVPAKGKDASAIVIGQSQTVHHLENHRLGRGRFHWLLGHRILYIGKSE